MTSWYVVAELLEIFISFVWQGEILTIPSNNLIGICRSWLNTGADWWIVVGKKRTTSFTGSDVKWLHTILGHVIGRNIK